MNIDYETGKWIENLVLALEQRIAVLEQKAFPEKFLSPPDNKK